MLRNKTQDVVGSKQLNETMLKYAQVNNIAGVSNCLQKGANPVYQNGALLLISAVCGYAKLAKLCLSVGQFNKEQLQSALERAERLDLKKLLEAKINEIV